MTYFELQNHHGEKIGARVYFKLSLARGVAKRLAGKWSHDNSKRGSGIKIVEVDNAAIYASTRTVEWFNT